MENILSKVSAFKTKAFQFSALELIFWSTFAAYYPFLVIYLDSKGFNNTTIGTILSINSFIVVFAQPFWGFLSDWIQSTKKVFILCLSMAALLWLSVPLYNSVLIISIVFAVLTFFESPLTPLFDSWVVQGIKSEENVYYGSIRVWGSIGFAFTVYIFGKLVDQFGLGIVFPGFIILAAITIITSLAIKTPKSDSVSSIRNLNFAGLLKNYRYVTFIIFASILFIPHRAAFTFLPRLIEHLGGNREIFGLALSVLALGEAPFFFLSGFLIKKFKPIQLIIFSSIFFTLRQIFLALIPTPMMAVILQVIQGPSYALFLTGTVYYIDSLTPPELKASAQTLASAVFVGASGIVASYGGGWIIDHFGLIRLYNIGLIISLAISILFLLSFPLEKLLNRTKTQDNK